MSPSLIELRVATGGRPLLANHRLHYQAKAAEVREWKTAAYYALGSHRHDRYERVSLVVKPRYPKGQLPDIDAIVPTAKAIVDALVDAQVIPDDNPWHYTGLTLDPPARAPQLSHPEVYVAVIPRDTPADGHPPRAECGCGHR